MEYTQVCVRYVYIYKSIYMCVKVFVVVSVYGREFKTTCSR